MSIVFGVISYLPDNNIRDKRLKAHLLCYDSYLYNHYEPEMFLEEISETDKFNYNRST